MICLLPLLTLLTIDAAVYNTSKMSFPLLSEPRRVNLGYDSPTIRNFNDEAGDV